MSAAAHGAAGVTPDLSDAAPPFGKPASSTISASISLNPPSQGPNSTTVDMVLQYIYKVNGPLGTHHHAVLRQLHLCGVTGSGVPPQPDEKFLRLRHGSRAIRLLV